MSCNVDAPPVCDITLRVSIPIGFSNELQLFGDLAILDGVADVSIPIGFSNELQLTESALDHRRAGCVSIPIGFSNELQLNLPYLPRDYAESFNPYRVFQ